MQQSRGEAETVRYDVRIAALLFPQLASAGALMGEGILAGAWALQGVVFFACLPPIAAMPERRLQLLLHHVGILMVPAMALYFATEPKIGAVGAVLGWTAWTVNLVVMPFLAWFWWHHPGSDWGAPGRSADAVQSPHGSTD